MRTFVRCAQIFLVRQDHMLDSDETQLISGHELNKKVGHVFTVDCTSNIQRLNTGVVGGLKYGLALAHGTRIPYNAKYVAIQITTAKAAWQIPLAFLWEYDTVL